MASTVPAKSQPLHNFPLSHLKWSSGHQRPRSSSNSAARLSSASPHRSPPLSHGSPQHQSPLRQSLPSLHSPFRGGESTSASSPRHSPMRGGGGCGEESASPVQVRKSPMRSGASDDSTAPPSSESPICDSAAAGKSESSCKTGKPLIEYRRQGRNPVSSDGVKNGALVSSSVDRDDSIDGKSDKKLKVAVEPVNKETRSSKILIKIRPNTSKIAEEVQVEEEGKVEDNEVLEEGKLLDAFDDEESLPKIWNLRPRKPIRKSLNLNGSGFKNSGSTMHEKRSQSPRVNPNSNCNYNRSETQKKEKRKIGFTLTLSREEIEEDIYALFGSKVSRRPKKKQKIAQKLLDNLFPGAWLSSVTAESYKVSEHPGKG